MKNFRPHPGKPRAPKKQGESAVSKRLIDALHKMYPSSKFWKNHGTEYVEAGMPDVMGVVNGKHFGIEVKLGDGWFKPKQVMFLRALHRAGGIAVGFLYREGKYYVIPIEAMGHRGTHKRELWKEIRFPDELELLYWSRL